MRAGEAFSGASRRVPVMAQLAAHALGLIGVDENRFWTDPEVFITNHLPSPEYYSLNIPSTYFDIYNIEAEVLGQKLVYLKGEFPEIDHDRRLIRTPEDQDRLQSRPPEMIYKPGRRLRSGWKGRG